MGKWREMQYYRDGNPTKTTKRLRRRHLFSRHRDWVGVWKSPCGQLTIAVQLSEGVTDSQKCSHCVKIEFRKFEKKVKKKAARELAKVRKEIAKEKIKAKGGRGK